MINLFKRTPQTATAEDAPSGEELHLFIYFNHGGHEVELSTVNWDGEMTPNPFEEFIDWFANGTEPGFTFELTTSTGLQIIAVARVAVAYYKIERHLK